MVAAFDGALSPILRGDVAVSRLHKSILIALAALPTSHAFGQQATPPNVLSPIIVSSPPVSGATLERAPVDRQSAAPASASSAAVPVPTADGGAAGAAGEPLAAGTTANAIGTSVTVVTGEDLRRQNVRYVSEALRGLPGVQVSSSGSAGSLTQIRIRGAEGRHTRIIIDGIEANTTKDGEFDFSNLLTDDIERIEVIRGPMSAIYGSGALGGVVNIVTRRPSGPPSLSVRVEAGSYGTQEIAARIAAGSDQGYLALSGQARRTDGFNISPYDSEADGTRLTNFALRAGLRVAPAARLDATLRLTDKRAQYDDFGSVNRSPFSTSDDAYNVLKEKTTLAGATFAWDMLDGRLTQELKANFASNLSVNRYEPIYGFSVGTINNTRDEGTRLLGGYNVTYRTDIPALSLKQAISGLIEARRETYTPFSDWGYSTDGDGTERRRGQVAYAAEWRGTFADRLTVIAGARREDNDTFRDYNTWRGSISYQWKETGLRPHASIGTGVKLPGLYDQFGSSSTAYKANPNLRPETSFGYDAGVEWTTWGGRALFDVTYFSQNLKDKITGFGGFDLSDFKSFTTNTAGESTRTGVELSSRFLLAPAISLGLAYTYTDARQPDDSPELRRAPHGGRADVRYAFDQGRGNVSVVVSYNGDSLDKGFGPPPTYATGIVSMPHYWLAAVSASYKVAPNVELYGRIENALDQKYQEIYGYQTARIAAYAGVKITFDDIVGGKK